MLVVPGIAWRAMPDDATRGPGAPSTEHPVQPGSRASPERRSPVPRASPAPAGDHPHLSSFEKQMRGRTSSFISTALLTAASSHKAGVANGERVSKMCVHRECAAADRQHPRCLTGIQVL